MVRQTYQGNTLWTLPGGRIETDEEPSDCAIRGCSKFR
ncbi:NUDIX hydrolase [Bacillus sp. SD088]